MGIHTFCVEQLQHLSEDLKGSCTFALIMLHKSPWPCARAQEAAGLVGILQQHHDMHPPMYPLWDTMGPAAEAALAGIFRVQLTSRRMTF
jgi:hypothetical protein